MNSLNGSDLLPEGSIFHQIKCTAFQRKAAVPTGGSTARPKGAAPATHKEWSGRAKAEAAGHTEGRSG